jgi:hypothetical protein
MKASASESIAVVARDEFKDRRRTGNTFGLAAANGG